jgi:MFS family permease
MTKSQAQVSAPGYGSRRFGDFRLLLVTRVVRAFAFGFVPVVLGTHLQSRGLGPVQIGGILAVGLLSASAVGLLLAGASNRIGRRLALFATGCLMVLSGLAMAFATPFWLLLAGAMTGMLGAGGTDLGPFLPLEQAVLVESVPATSRNQAFGRYSLTGALASSAGALTAGIGTDLERTQTMFVGFAVIGLITAVLPLLLSSSVETPVSATRLVSLRPILPLAALIALDAFGSGLVTTAVLAFWLHVRFGAGPEILGPAFAAMALVVAASYEVAARLGNRFGLINTMVFTHLPSNVILVLVAFSTTLPVAIGLLLARNAISQMDIPVRQAYIASVVPPSDRAGALAVTGAVRGVAQACGPLISGLAIQAASFGIPLLVGGGVKALYDGGLYFGYRRRPAEHETRGTTN